MGEAHCPQTITRLFDDAGVRMMVGTDGGGQAPGQSIHQEFDELAKAGLSPLKVLQMTTLNPAEFLGRTGTMGSIDVGKNADIVLLDGNPGIRLLQHFPQPNASAKIVEELTRRSDKAAATCSTRKKRLRQPVSHKTPCCWCGSAADYAR